MGRSRKKEPGVTKAFLGRLRSFSRRHRLIEPGDKVLVAVSGEKDSAALLDALNRLRDKERFELAVVHCNHQLRGRESNQDEAFVRRIADRYKLECYVERLEIKEYSKKGKYSIEQAARNLRYQAFQKVLGSSGFGKVATGHTADDNAETVLLNLFRGSGVAGLTGIPVRRRDVNVVRPLLFASREEVKAYARARNLKHREDSSNRRQIFRRNYIRRTLVPSLRRNVNENIVGTLNRTAEIFSHLNEYVNAQVREGFQSAARALEEDRVVLDICELRSYLYFIRESILLLAARSLTPREVSFEKIRSILDLTEAQTGSQVEVFQDVVACRDRDVLLLERVDRRRGFQYGVSVNQKQQFPGFELESSFVDRDEMVFGEERNVAFVDADKLGGTLLLRSWKDGDWFIPIVMGGKKKLSDYFVDEKVPLFEKQRIPVLESEGNIVWVCGRRLDDRFKVTEQTQRILKLKITYQWV